MRKGEVTDRFDVEYFSLISAFTSKSIYPSHSIGFNFHIRDGDHNKFPPEHNSDAINGVRYLRSQDIKDDTIIDENPIYVSKEYFSKLKRSEVRSGYILFSIMASVGGVVVYPEGRENCTANRAVGILVPKPNNSILPHYFKTLFNTKFGETLIQTLKKGGVQQRINLFDFANLKIPVPPLAIQTQIVEKFEKAYNAKRAKEAEAKELLAGIDAYLLDKLGIAQPTNKETTKKTFYTKFSEVSGSRFDPIYYASELFGFLKATQYELKTIKEITLSVKSGFGAGKQDQEREENGLIQIRPTNIGNEGNLKLEKNVYLPLELLESQQDIFLQKGDVLFNNTNSQELVGKTVYFNEEGDFLFSNHITRIRVKETNILPYFLALLLNVFQHRKIFYGICTNWNNQSGVGNDLLGSLKIPLPPLEIQNEIAAHICQVREKAKRLEMQAKAEIEHAKIEVEWMILGE